MDHKFIIFIIFFIYKMQYLNTGKDKAVNDWRDIFKKDNVLDLVNYYGIEHYDNYGLTPLLAALKWKKKNLVYDLLEMGADPNKTTYFEKEPALSLALFNGYDDIFLLLLEKGADFNVKTNLNQSFLEILSLLNNVLLVKILLELGALNNENVGVISLKNAIERDNYEIVKLLLQYGANPNGHQITPLMWASMYGNPKIVKLLIENGADINKRNHIGMTAFDYARKNSIKSLLRETTTDDSYRATDNKMNDLGGFKGRRGGHLLEQTFIEKSIRSTRSPKRNTERLRYY